MATVTGVAHAANAANGTYLVSNEDYSCLKAREECLFCLAIGNSSRMARYECAWLKAFAWLHIVSLKSISKGQGVANSYLDSVCLGCPQFYVYQGKGVYRGVAGLAALASGCFPFQQRS